MSIKGPAIFLAQFAGDEAPFNNLENISKWASELGYIGVQIPSLEFEHQYIQVHLPILKYFLDC